MCRYESRLQSQSSTFFSSEINVFSELLENEYKKRKESRMLAVKKKSEI